MRISSQFKAIRKLAFWKRDEGVAAVEFAIILPFLVFLMMGGFEFSEIYNVIRKVDKTTATTSDIISQYSCLPQDELDAILDTTTRVMAPYENTTTNLTITSWSLSADDDGNITVDWSRKNDGTSPDAPGDPAPDWATSAEVPDGASRIVTQVDYVYDLPLNFVMSDAVTGGQYTMEKRYFSVPRGPKINQPTVSITDDPC